MRGRRGVIGPWGLNCYITEEQILNATSGPVGILKQGEGDIRKMLNAMWA